MSVVLSKHLPLLASAPDGIQKLRGLILELAVRGKLLPQDPNDEPASELLKQIAKERVLQEANGTGKKSKPTPPVSKDEQAFELPDGWAWVRFADVTSYIQRGKGPDYADKSDYVVVSQKCVRWYGLDLSQARWITPESFSKYDTIRLLRGGDVLWNSTGTGTIGRAVVVPSLEAGQVLVADSHVTVVRSVLMSPIYLWRWIQSPSVQREIEGSASGSTNQIELATSTVTAHPLPLPPLAEQHRIVAKVDELMALCDRLEAEQADAASAHARLVETLLGTLTQSTDAADLAANWQRLAEHFDTLFATEASIDALKQTVLQLAVMGKLVFSGTEQQWQTLRLDAICSEIVDCPHSTPKWTPTGKICVRTSQFRPGRLDLSSSRFVSEDTYAERIARLRPEANDILYSREGGILGVACRLPPGVELCLGQRMMLLRPGREVSPAFLELVLNSPVITALARANTTGGAAPRVNVATVKAYPIPLPPIAEQHRIVAKVDELMGLCDHLQADLATARQQQARLADTLIEYALEAA
ncbi:MAG: restriction endonuclease subunit S [Proteobacteria bacterium]|nr:restriction endonuclease subunit S [Pseudomonadota bacterium]